MSIKRTKPKTERRAAGGGLSAGFGGTPAKKKEPTWEEAMADKTDADFVGYSARGHFTEGTLLSHPTFGKGVVLGVEGKKMDVLFDKSRKTLIMDTVLAPRPPE